MGNKAGAFGVDFELCGFADAADAQAKSRAAIRMERSRRIMPGGDQFAAQLQNRRIRLDRDAGRGADVRTNQLGADVFTMVNTSC
jgi:hypothetical protein